MISVVIPVYNPNLDYLQEALISIRSQSMKDVEIVISVDGELNHDVEKLVKTYADVVNYNTGQRGIFSNLNNGIQKASYPYVQILCQDDRLVPLSLKKIYDSINQSGASFLYCQMNEIDENSQPTGLRPGPSSESFKTFSKEDTLRLFLKYGCLPGNLSTVCMKKQNYFDVGGFNEDLAYCGDFDLWTRMILHSGKMGVLFPHLVDVRTHRNRASYTIGHGIWAREVLGIYEKIYLNIRNKDKQQKQSFHATLFKIFLIRVRKEKSLRFLKELLTIECFSILYALGLLIGTMGFLKLEPDDIRL
jgi:glycosyltransferase involved in cell wall biosynthesis